ncbi:hypothetical protein PR003_g15375 [Phytophthora rubi]|uniref:Uncharacterized protein n=1 Tax=Phytophthora rubi TaxID=129364 RepID=A0A6A4EZW4_9STRA|nr:hypothetical protein PR003_g15375 [Phytophthora rubi]
MFAATPCGRGRRCVRRGSVREQAGKGGGRAARQAGGAFHAFWPMSNLIAIGTHWMRPSAATKPYTRTAEPTVSNFATDGSAAIALTELLSLPEPLSVHGCESARGTARST